VIALQTHWSWLPAIYLFLGGLSGGTFLVSSIVRFASGDRYDHLAKIAPWVSFISLAAGLLCLIAEVEKPFQAMMMWKSFVNFSSWMAIGAWLLFVSILVFLICALFSTPRICTALGELWKPFGTHAEGIVKVTMGIGSVLGFFVALYTGILLGAAPSIPLWDTWLIPALFTVSAMDAGASVTIAILLAEKDERGSKSHVNRLEAALLVLIVLEGAVIAALLTTMSGGTLSEALSASIMLSGSLAVPFWGLVVGLGLGIPGLLGIVGLTGVVKNSSVSRALKVAAVACALVGGFTLRFVILSSGIHGIMMSPDAYQAALGIYQIIS